MPRLQTPRLQTGVFQTVITVASGQSLKSVLSVFVKKVISLASVHISHTSLGTRIINPEHSPVAKVTKIHGFIFGICDFYVALAYSISASPLALTFTPLL